MVETDLLLRQAPGTGRGEKRVDFGWFRGCLGVVSGVNSGVFFGEKSLFCADSKVRTAFFYFSTRRTMLFERVSRLILCMSELGLESDVIDSTMQNRRYSDFRALT